MRRPAGRSTLSLWVEEEAVCQGASELALVLALLRHLPAFEHVGCKSHRLEVLTNTGCPSLYAQRIAEGRAVQRNSPLVADRVCSDVKTLEHQVALLPLGAFGESALYLMHTSFICLIGNPEGIPQPLASKESEKQRNSPFLRVNVSPARSSRVLSIQPSITIALQLQPRRKQSCYVGRREASPQA